MLPSTSDLEHDHLPFQPSSAQAQSPAHSKPYTVSTRSPRTSSPLSTTFLGTPAQLSPASRVRAEGEPDHPHQQPASGSSSSNDNGPTALPSKSSGTPLQPLQLITSGSNGLTTASPQSLAFSHGSSAQYSTPSAEAPASASDVLSERTHSFAAPISPQDSVEHLQTL